MAGVKRDCVQACQSFLWGGEGVPSYDDVGSCSCSCEDTWRTTNIAGYPSCVPSPAYHAFGYTGLVLTMVHLTHAVYNLKQQRRAEALQRGSGMWVKMLVDVYLQQLTMISIAHAPILGLYFSLVLWLPDDIVHWSAVVLGVSHILSGIGAVLTVQVLIRSTDPRLMKKDAAALKVSAALTHPVGHHTSFSVVSIGAVCLISLASIGKTETGYRIMSSVYILVTVTRILVIALCSRSMIQMIDKSMARHAAKQRVDSPRSDDSFTIAMDPKLVGAKKTILSALFFCINLTSIASAVLLFALVTEYGYDNPIMFLATPLAFGPMIALMFHIQLHSKRNKVTRSKKNRVANVGKKAGSTTDGAQTGTYSARSAGVMKNSSRVLPMVDKIQNAETQVLFIKGRSDDMVEEGGADDEEKREDEV